MPKTKSQGIPKLEDEVEVEAEEKARAVDSVLVELPVSVADDGGYHKRRIDMHLSKAQARALRALFDGLHEGGKRRRDGLYINTPVDAVRWLLETIEAELPPERQP